MITVREALQSVLDSGVKKYGIAKTLGVQPIMIDNYLKGKVKSPGFATCKKIYDNYGIVTFPYYKEELDRSAEQSLMELD